MDHNKHEMISYSVTMGLSINKIFHCLPFGRPLLHHKFLNKKSARLALALWSPSTIVLLLEVLPVSTLGKYFGTSSGLQLVIAQRKEQPI